MGAEISGRHIERCLILELRVRRGQEPLRLLR